MKILISGICGFAGAALAKGLAEHGGFSVAGFDNLSRKGSETNLPLLRAMGADVRIGDVRDMGFLKSLPASEWILDCAAEPSVLAGINFPSLPSVQTNLFGTIHLLELCRMHGAGFILLSTSRVYSIHELANLPLNEEETRFTLRKGSKSEGWSEQGIGENFSTAPPLSLYGGSKLSSECMAIEYSSAFGFPCWINRCGVLAGAGQFGKFDQGIFSYWIHSWKAGRPLRYIGFRGSGKQVRDCMHPRDLVPALIKQMQSTSSKALKARSQILNFSGGPANSMSLRELSEWCRKRLGPSPSEASLASEAESGDRPYDIPWLVLDSTRANAAWDWSPATSLDKILEDIAAHAENNPRWLEISSAA